MQRCHCALYRESWRRDGRVLSDPLVPLELQQWLAGNRSERDRRHAHVGVDVGGVRFPQEAHGLARLQQGALLHGGPEECHDQAEAQEHRGNRAAQHQDPVVDLRQVQGHGGGQNAGHEAGGHDVEDAVQVQAVHAQPQLLLATVQSVQQTRRALRVEAGAIRTGCIAHTGDAQHRRRHR